MWVAKAVSALHTFAATIEECNGIYTYDMFCKSAIYLVDLE